MKRARGTATDPTRRLLGRQLANIILRSKCGADTRDLTFEAGSTDSHGNTVRVNALAWLENNGFVRFHWGLRRWFLTSSGTRLAQETD